MVIVADSRRQIDLQSRGGQRNGPLDELAVGSASLEGPRVSLHPLVSDADIKEVLQIFATFGRR